MDEPAYRLEAELGALHGEYNRMAMHKHLHQMREAGDLDEEIEPWTHTDQVILNAHYERICQIRDLLDERC